MKTSVKTHKSVVKRLLGLAAAVFFSLAALPHTATAQAPSPCLVYSSRSTSLTTGYSGHASGSTGILVLGPQFTEETETYSNNGPVNIPVTKREAQEYYISGPKNQKSYSKVQVNDGSGPITKRVVGFFNMAPKNSPKPALFFAMMPFDYSVTTLNDYDGSIIGKATEQSPYSGAPKILMATAMQSAYRSYDLNANNVWDGNGNPPEQKSLGQDGTTRIASLISGKTTYSHDSKLNELVKDKNFAEACAAIEKRFQDIGYTPLDGMN